MSKKPMFLFAAVYPDVAAAEIDYATVKELHSAGDIGSYDAAVMTKDANGNVKVHKHEKPTQHGAWIGLAAGAAGAVLFPFLLPGLIVTGAAGAGIGAWIGHVSHGLSRNDVKEIAALLDRGQAAMIVVGVDKDAEMIEKAMSRATEQMVKQLDADWDEAQREADMAMKKA